MILESVSIYMPERQGFGSQVKASGYAQRQLSGLVTVSPRQPARPEPPREPPKRPRSVPNSKVNKVHQLAASSAVSGPVHSIALLALHNALGAVG